MMDYLKTDVKLKKFGPVQLHYGDVNGIAG